MAFSFSEADIERIAAVLDTSPQHENGLVRFELHDEESGRRISVEIQTRLDLPQHLAQNGASSLISVYASSSFLQLQRCTGFIASEELGEVIFFARQGGATNGLVVEREAGCSLYANVDDRLLSADFAQLPSELIMSSVALSMTEDIFDSLS